MECRNLANRGDALIDQADLGARDLVDGPPVGGPPVGGKPVDGQDRPARFAELDICRGLIMVGMALDHCVYLLWSGAREPSFLFWYGPLLSDENLSELIIRFVSNLCAPGFFLLMGAGFALFAEARRGQGWSEAAIRRYGISRGLMLVALQFLVENPLWTLKPGENWLNYVGVLYALGVGLATTAVMNRFANAFIALIAVALVMLPEFIAPCFQGQSDQLPLAVALLVLPGKSHGLVVYFTYLPWLGISLLGFLLGRSMLKDQRRGLLNAACLGVGLISFALLLRMTAGFGNLGIVENHGWIGSLAMVKYGPSLVFLGWNTGLILVSWMLLWAINRRFPRFVSPWRILGGSPLFFYIGHLMLFASLSRALGPSRLSLPWTLVVWIVGLSALWPLCQRFSLFKRTKPVSSPWRMF